MSDLSPEGSGKVRQPQPAQPDTIKRAQARKAPEMKMLDYYLVLIKDRRVRTDGKVFLAKAPQILRSITLPTNHSFRVEPDEELVLIKDYVAPGP